MLKTKEALTRVEALEYCKAVISANPAKNVWCSWNKDVISGQKPKGFVLGAATTAEIVALEARIKDIEAELLKRIKLRDNYLIDIAKLKNSPVVVPPVVIMPSTPAPVPQVVTPPITKLPATTTTPVTPTNVTVPTVGDNLTPALCGNKRFIRKVTVATSAELKSALLMATAGDYISIVAGTYTDPFVLLNKQTSAANPITVCGEKGVEIKSAAKYAGYGFLLKNVSGVVLANVHISGYLKGVILEDATNSIIHNITVSDIGHEGVHFRQNSSNNIIRKSTIYNTGIVEDWFGEGVYIGSANSNWCKYSACGPDKSDFNQVLDNDIYHTGAESIDIKEGSTGGIVIGNRFEGSGMTGEYADSFIDVKGDRYIIQNNTGKIAFNSKGVSYQTDAYQHHVVYENTGNNNIFSGNSVSGALPGYVVYITKKGVGNVVTCDNVPLTSAKGITNVGVCKP